MISPVQKTVNLKIPVKAHRPRNRAQATTVHALNTCACFAAILFVMLSGRSVCCPLTVMTVRSGKLHISGGCLGQGTIPQGKQNLRFQGESVQRSLIF